MISKRTVYNYIENNEENRISFADLRATHSEFKVTVQIEENIKIVMELVTECPLLTVDEIGELTGLTHGTIHRFISEDLALKSVCSKWVPYVLTNNNRAARKSAAKV
jgi:hypothetical protein